MVHRFKYKTIKHLEERIRENLWDLWSDEST